MDILSSFSADNEAHLHQEVNALRNSLSAEMERTSQLGAEVARLQASLNESRLLCCSAHQLRAERDMYKQRLDDQLQFKRGPLEARLLEANRVVFEQRLQFRGIVDYLAMQRDWVREWAVLGRENMRLRELIEKREAGSEVEELRRALFDLQSKFSENLISTKQYEAIVAVHESKCRTISLENDRLTADNNLFKEQLRRLMKKHFGMKSAGEKRVSEDREDDDASLDQSVSKKVNQSIDGSGY